MRVRYASHYKTQNATLGQELRARHQAWACVRNPCANGRRGPLYAIVYGVIDPKSDNRKLLRNHKIFRTQDDFETYVNKSKQGILAVYGEGQYLN